VVSSSFLSSLPVRSSPVKFEVYQVCAINEEGNTYWSQTYAKREDAEELYNRTIQHENVVICVHSVY
jgi:hypothetical protein